MAVEERFDRRPTVVALRALGLGGFLTGLPAVRALVEAFPRHRVVVAAPEALQPLADLAGVALESVEPLEPLPRRSRGPDVVVNLHGCGPESHAVAAAARPRRLIAFAHPEHPWSAEMPTWREDEHDVQRWCRLLDESGIPADSTALDLSAPPETVDHGATIIHPGAASAARRWPTYRFAAVARSEIAAGRRVVVTGGPGERGLAWEVAERACLPDEDVIAGRTDLRELAALIAGAGRVICGDTGVAHLATALGTPSVVLFGPTSPELRGPPPERRHRHRVLWAGGTGDAHADRPDPGLLELTVDDVLEQLVLLEEPDAVPA